MTEGTLEQVVAGDARWCIVNGDSLRVLGLLPDGCVDLFLTDPPYSSGGAFRGDRTGSTATKYISSDSANQSVPDFDGDTRDQRGFTLWCALWSAEALRASALGGRIAAFTDWRQLPSLCDALQAGGWTWRGVAPWDKGEGTRPRNGGLRAQCEFVVWGTRGPLVETGVYLPGCFRIPADRDKIHQAIKPLALMDALVTLAPVDALVCDPFCGSGTTIAAAVRTGRRAIGIEINAAWAELARERVRAEVSGSDYRSREAGQIALFGGGGA